MKKILLVFAVLFLFAASAFADDVRFDNMRTVVLVDTTQTSYAARFMKKRLKQPFRIPYWDRIETENALSPDEVTEENLRQIAAKYKADVVLVPVVQTWYWRQHMAGYWRFDDEIITEYMYRLTVYAYDKRTDSWNSYSDSRRDVESASILNNPDDVLGEAMDRIMSKLPYKRIPTDIETASGMIPGLQTRTTSGGAKIITQKFPQPI